MHFHFLYLLGSFLITALFNVAIAQTSPREIRDLLDQWVETEQIISKEHSNWEIEEALLLETQDLLTLESNRLSAELSDLKSTATASDEERTSLSSEKEALKKASEVVASSIGNLEKKLKEILPFLPSPLLEKIRPLIRRLPDNPDNSDLSLGQRVQNIVGILSQANEFNTSIIASSEARAFEEGKVVQVTTLYWGLAMAYYVDDSGKYAGIGVPTNKGWEWNEIKGIGSKIQSLVEMYEGNIDVRFVNAPAKIHTLHSSSATN
jgi:hypothetical protein